MDSPDTPVCAMRRLSDADLDAEIARTAESLETLASRFDSLLDERDRRSGCPQVALSADAYAYLDAHRDARTAH